MKTLALLGMIALLGLGRAQAIEVEVVGNDYSVPKIYNEQGEARGILVDILRYLDRELPQDTLSLRLYPWARAYKLAESGQVAIVGLSLTKERLAIFDYSEPLFYDEVVMVVRKGREFEFTGIEALSGKRLGIGSGGTFGDDFEQARRSGVFMVDEDNGPTVRLKKLLTGRIDVALINPGRAGLNAALKRDPALIGREDDFSVLDRPLKRDANYLGVPKSLKLGDFLERFNQAVRRGYSNGAIPRLIEQYQPRPTP
ncbi:substrate-binding periplasmic protein [Chitinimonas lacunae]|uniref:Substrate-binding periplasmic protein n=1 Tax=Chitinimonas lacunae TaxID=1963018 RepID=A0ABV8MRU1_9NEIS